jgi:hypothetical protein
MKKGLKLALFSATFSLVLLSLISCGKGDVTQKPGIINGGVTWIDPNGGPGTAGNIGLGGVIINLWDANDQKVQTAESKSDGIFAFESVVPGTYTVTGYAPASAPDSTEKRWITKGVVVKSEIVTNVNFDYQNSVGDALPAKYLP